MRKKIVKGSLLSLFDQSIVSASNFLMGVLVARSIAPTEFGTFSLLYTSIIILSGVQNALVTGPLRVFGVDTKNNDGTDHVHAQIFLQLLLGSVLVIGAVTYLHLYTAFSNDIILVFSICIFFVQFQELIRVIEVTKLNMAYLLTIDAITHGSRICILVLLYICDQMTTTVVFGVIILSCLFSVIHFNYKICKVRRLYSAFKRNALRSIRYGRWLLIETIAYTASTQVYLYFTDLWVGREEVAALNAVQIMLNVVNIVHIGVASYAIPVARKKLLDDGYSSWKKWIISVGGLLVMSTLIIVVILATFSETLLTYLYSPFYAQYAYLMKILALSTCLLALNVAFSAAFRTAGLPHVGVSAKIISGSVTILVAYPLINNYGVSGAAVGLLITQLLWVIVYIKYVMRGVLEEKSILKHIDKYHIK